MPQGLADTHRGTSPMKTRHLPNDQRFKHARGRRGVMTFPMQKWLDAAEKKVRKTGPFNQWKETAWLLWRKGKYEEKLD